MGSLGAGLSVAVAASVMLLVVSTVVAFRGWPDDLGSSSDPVSRLVSGVASDSGSATATSQHGKPPLVLPVASSPAAAPTHRSSRPLGGDRGGTSPATSSTPTTSSTSTSSAPGTGSGGSTKSGDVGATVHDVTTNAGGAVTGTTKKAADLVRPVAPTVSDTIDRTGTSVGSTVGKTGDAVAQALSQVGH